MKTKKQIIEEKFHDHYASSVDFNKLNIKEDFSLGAQENRFTRSLFGNLKNKKILDLGCGFGETAIHWAQLGAKVEAIDISSGCIKIAKKLARRHKVVNSCHFQQMTSEKLNFRKKSFDYVFGNGVLHHIDTNKSIPEIYRVLKKQGLAVFVEPLAYNPVINIYRQIADEVRTPTEKPLTFNDIENIKKSFNKVKHKEFQLTTLLIFIWFFIASRISPNKERYWRKILKVKGSLKSILKWLIKLDIFLLKFFPLFRYLCWNTVIVLQK